jgi:hypothetical protein
MRWIWLAALLVPLPALADDVKPERVAIVGRVGDGVWTDAATEARIDQQAELAVVVVGKRGRKRVVLAPDGVTTVVLSGSRLATEKLAAAKVQWSTVEPHGFRTSRVGALA